MTTDPNSWYSLLYAVLGAAALWLLQRFKVAPAPALPPMPAPGPSPAPASSPAPSLPPLAPSMPLLPRTGNPLIDLALPMMIDAVANAFRKRFGDEVEKAVDGIAGRIMPTAAEWSSPVAPGAATPVNTPLGVASLVPPTFSQSPLPATSAGS